jgi:prepilin-type N-terminal cleavage/methylation domain-containing protein
MDLKSRGFTLLELMIVIIIIGIMATIGVMQYVASIEKSRGTEARTVIGNLRTLCGRLYMQDMSTANCNQNGLGIGNAIELLPGPNAAACRQTNFFWYNSIPTGPTSVRLEATRCTGGTGKSPTGSSPAILRLDVDYVAGTDTWSSTGGY